ncbi:MAG: hypothetical protein KF782_21355 [Labilithrix sp.]|nr:hypothetical protein [Labilithrix sp.]
MGLSAFPLRPRSRALRRMFERDFCGVALQEPHQALLDPVLGLFGTVGMERVRGLPEVLEDMDQVGDDRDLGANLPRHPSHEAKLVLVSVDEDDPTALALGIASKGLVEGVG